MWKSLQRRRQLCRQTLSFSTMKLLYARLTLTRFTTLYFIFAIVTCVILTVQQGLTFRENSTAVSVLSPFLNEDPGHESIVLLEKGVLEVCDGLPNQPGTNCTKIMTFGQNNLTARSMWDDNFMWPRKPDVDDQSEDDFDPYFDISLDETLSPGGPCVPSLQWLDGILQDARREDVVTLLFQIWLLSLATITLLNESIPHLVAALLGHVLGAAWSCYRVSSTQAHRAVYENQIIPEACDNHDFMGDWWDIRIRHAITIVVVNITTLVCLSYLSFKLFQVYANQSFSRVGAPPKIHRIHKLVLFLSVCLQLTQFFSLASTALWLNKVCYGSMHHLTDHSNLYMATFIIMLVFQFPWLYLGWCSVRRECKIRFGVFSVISVFLLALSSFLFSRPMYRYIFMAWPFFATLTVTAYVFTIVSSVLGVVCRLNFGKGLAHYLQVMHALAGVDFTAVHFSKGYDVEEKDGTYASGFEKSDPHRAFSIQIPALAYSQSQGPNAKLQQNNATALTQVKRGSSIYSEPQGMPILLSSSPPLVSELGPAPERLSRLSYSQSRSQKRTTTYGLPTSRGDDGRWGDKTQREWASAEVPALPVPDSKRMLEKGGDGDVSSPMTSSMRGLILSGPPGIERPKAAVTKTPSSPILFKQPSSAGYAPSYPRSEASSPPSNAKLSSSPAHSEFLEGSLHSSSSERPTSVASTWSIDDPVEMNI
ncbi:hypothetical protein M413DRAFT_448195 [Hebeloma cylindrosporum]|uniref:Uncharacterized protein n=1 Tax=Hebeloma cylindrosporum TaxID=76867 RepID=A0A0C2XJE3_HEBCY|nr:hypothetical protein M413DRAFT_448195 [Hebeloma cylindrosporum h7]